MNIYLIIGICISVGIIIGSVIVGIILYPRAKNQATINEEIYRQNDLLSKSVKALTESRIGYEKEIAKLEAKKATLTESLQVAEESAKMVTDKAFEIAQIQLEASLEKCGREYETATQEYKNEYSAVMAESAGAIALMIEEKNQELAQVQEELNRIKAIRASIIQAQVREKEIQEKLDFYCLQLDSIDEEEIKILEQIKDRLTKPRILSMLIWQTYFQKKMTSLCNNVLGTKTVCGIYKITNIKTNECYIGQAVDIASRWKEHAKCGLGIDTPQGSKLYKAMLKDGLTNFSWELLEAVPSSKLNIQEAYYIDLYDSANYGYNILKSSGK